MGSQVAQAIAAAQPERVERLVLIGSATSFDTPDLQPFAQAVASSGIRSRPSSPGTSR